MQYSSKDCEFLGRQVIAGKYVTRSFCIMGILLALLAGCVGGYLFAGSSSADDQNKRSLRDRAAQGPSPMEQQLAETAKRLETQAQQAPDNVEGWVSLGNAYFDMRKYSEAIEAYNKALILNPSMPDVLVDCGVMYQMAGQYQEAIQYFDRALALQPKHEKAIFNKGVVLHNNLKKDAEALDTWRKLLILNPQFKTPSGQLLSDVVKAHDSGK